MSGTRSGQTKPRLPGTTFRLPRGLDALRERFLLCAVGLSLGLGLTACGPVPPADGPSTPASSTADGTNISEDGSPPPAEKPWFEERGASLGIDFRHHDRYEGEFSMPEIIGPGVALFDANGDGRLDILAINGTADDGAGPIGSVPSPSVGDRLFLQQGSGTFVDATAGSGLGSGHGMGCAVGDIDNDGDLDVYVTRYGTDSLYRNRGDGTFDDVTAAAGVAVDGWSTSAGFFDADGDGWLDLYVVRYVAYDPTRKCSTLSGLPDYCGPLSFRGQPDVLLANRGDGTFDDISLAAGIARTPGRGLGLALEDFDDDGDLDVYVANDGEANQLWIRGEDGRFEDRAVVSGVAVNLLGRHEASMGVTVGDVDGNGHFDLFLTHLEQETNTLYLGSGNGAFEDRVAGSGLGTSSLPFTGFGTALFDGDLDGDLDLLVANGKVRLTGSVEAVDPTSAADPLRRYEEPDHLYLNQGDGRFAAHAAPGPLADAAIGRGLAVGDLDGDGDLDAVIANAQGPLRVLINGAPPGGRSLRVRAIDPRLRRQAIGAKIWLHQGNRRQLRTIRRVTSYLSSKPATAHFGIAEGSPVDGLTVRWPSGELEFFTVADPRWVTLTRGQGTPVADAVTIP